MKLTHQIRDNKVETEVNPSVPLGFFISNKQGGMLYFDANKDQTQFYAKVGDRTVKVLHDIRFDGEIVSVKNRIHSVDVSRNDNDHTFFVPHHMNGMVITQTEEQPVELVIDNSDQDPGRRKHSLYEKDGRIVIRSEKEGSTSPVYTAVEGGKITYDHDLKDGKDRFSLHVMTPKMAIAVSDNEESAISEADFLLSNEEHIREVQDKYVVPAEDFKDPEASLAYTCVLNATDHMFETDTENQSMNPVSRFSDAAPHHSAIATHALLSESEFRTVKNTLLAQIRANLFAPPGKNMTFNEIAWPLILFGRLMNNLCNRGKLYAYFTREELASAAADMIELINQLKCRFFENRHFIPEKEFPIESRAMMLALYDLEYALTKSETAQQAASVMRSETKHLLEQKLSELNQTPRLDLSSLTALFLTAYIYPHLMAREEWKSWIDTILDRINHNFKSLRQKAGPEQQLPLDMELFGLQNVAAIVLSRTDPEYYEKDINNILRSCVTDVLYKGVIGRPTSAYEHDVDLEKGVLFSNRHMLNNAFFIEMLRECA